MAPVVRVTLLGWSGVEGSVEVGVDVEPSVELPVFERRACSE